jgi:hypothetical protein
MTSHFVRYRTGRVGIAAAISCTGKEIAGVKTATTHRRTKVISSRVPRLKLVVPWCPWAARRTKQTWPRRGSWPAANMRARKASNAARWCSPSEMYGTTRSKIGGSATPASTAARQASAAGSWKARLFPPPVRSTYRRSAPRAMVSSAATCAGLLDSLSLSSTTSHSASSSLALPNAAPARCGARLRSPPRVSPHKASGARCQGMPLLARGQRASH